METSATVREQSQQKSSRTFVSWTMFFVSYALEKTRHSIRK